MFTTLRHFGYAVQPRKVEPVRLWRTFIGSPHSSHVVLLDVRHVDGVLLGVRDVQRERAAGIAAARDEEAVLAHAELELLAAGGALLVDRGHDRELELPAPGRAECPALPESMSSSARLRSRVNVLSKSARAFVQESLPSSTSSSASSMRAVYAVSKKSSKYGIRSSMTVRPSAVGMKRRSLLVDVAALLDLAQDLGVGRGPADAVLLEELDERGLVEARRRLRRLLLGRHGRGASASRPRRAAAASASPCPRPLPRRSAETAVGGAGSRRTSASSPRPGRPRRPAVISAAVVS